MGVDGLVGAHRAFPGRAFSKEIGGGVPGSGKPSRSRSKSYASLRNLHAARASRTVWGSVRA